MIAASAPRASKSPKRDIAAAFGNISRAHRHRLLVGIEDADDGQDAGPFKPSKCRPVIGLRDGPATGKDEPHRIPAGSLWSGITADGQDRLHV